MDTLKAPETNVNPSRPNSAIAPTSTVDISISCGKLLGNKKCSPFCVVYNQPRGSNKFIEWMRTETLKDGFNPSFSRKAQLVYTFEETQPLRFDVYDSGGDSLKLSDHTYIGFLETSLSIIVAAGAQGLTLPLIPNPSVNAGSDSVGEVTLIAEELEPVKNEVVLEFGASCITGSIRCCFVRSTVYFTFSKINESGKTVIVHRSEHIGGEIASWQPFYLAVESLCGEENEFQLIIKLYQVGVKGAEKELGSLTTNLTELVELKEGELILTKDGMKSQERFFLLQSTIQPIYTFLDYIRSGTQIHACFAIDFTSSNGDPADPKSLHFFSDDPNLPNPYEQAIYSVGNIIQDYDSVKLFPVYGFGAKTPPVMDVSHNFYVTLSGTPSVFGIAGVMEAYRDCIQQIKLFGPTCFSPVIKSVAGVAQACQNGKHYYILLIITDGIITDMEATKAAIVDAAGLPLSIIIVGVGKTDFTAMEELDGDSIRISSNGRKAERDIVQFVPYRDAKSWTDSVLGSEREEGTRKRSFCPEDLAADPTYKQAQRLLAKEVLAEVPRQVTTYFRSKGYFPDMKKEKAASADVTKSRTSNE